MNGITVAPHSVLPGLDVEEMYDVCAREGVAGMEFALVGDTDGETVGRLADTYDLPTLVLSSEAALRPTERPSLAHPSDDDAVARAEDLIRTAASLDCPSVLLVVGPQSPTYRGSALRRHLAETLTDLAGVAESVDVTLLVEPLCAAEFPGYLLHDAADAYDVVGHVRSERVKLLVDVYHQQRHAGAITETIREYGDAIGHVHLAGVPGRTEPTRGEVRLDAVLTALADVEYDGYVGLEYEPRREPVSTFRDVKRTIEEHATG